MLANPPSTPRQQQIPDVRIDRSSPSPSPSPSTSRPTSPRSPSRASIGSTRREGRRGSGGGDGGEDGEEGDGVKWGANFWVTIVDPQTQVTYYANPATGTLSWSPPTNTYLLPPSPTGEWWELKDASRGGLPYFYHTRTGETVWERPTEGFVIPLGRLQGMLQETEAEGGGKRLSFVAEEEWEGEEGVGLVGDQAEEGGGMAGAGEPATPSQPTRIETRNSPPPSPSPSPTRTTNRARSPSPSLSQRQQPTGILRTSPSRPSSRTRRTSAQTSESRRPATASAASPTSATSHSSAAGEGWERPGMGRAMSADAVPQQQHQQPGYPRSVQAQQQQQQQQRQEVQARPSLPNIQNLTAAAASIVSSPTSPQSAPGNGYGHGNGNATAYGVRYGGGNKSAPVSPAERGGQGFAGYPSQPAQFAPTQQPPKAPPNNYRTTTTSSSGTPSTPSSLSIPSIPSIPSITSSRSFPSAPSIPRQPPSPLFPARAPSSARSSQISLTSLHSLRPGTSGGGNGAKPPSPLRPLPGVPFARSSNGRPGTAGPGAGAGVGGGGGKSAGLSMTLGPAQGLGLPGGIAGARGVRQRSATLSGSSVRSSTISGPVNGFAGEFGELKVPLSPISPFSLRPIPTAPVPLPVLPSADVASKRLSTGDHPTLPHTLQDDIKRFAASEYAQKFFSQRRRGFWFLKRRKVPVAELMRWQRSPLDGPLLVMNGSLHRDAIAAFKVVQRIMGDRDPLKPVGVRMPSLPSARSLASSPSSSFSSTSTAWTAGAGGMGDGTSIVEEERWLLHAGISHVELRDEIYCQVMKQLTDNPSTESVFRGWQLLCVLIVTFPPSKYFEDHLTSFLQSSAHNTEGKIDVMAKYCLRRKEIIMWKGPRGKAPSLEEIEAASDAAFHPSVFGESLPLIMSLQAAVYPPDKEPVPIILPFLSSGILALGGMKEEGIFRLPGDTDAVASLRLRIERGHYHLEGVEDPHVCASLMKSWLRELREPVIPEGEVYNLALQAAASDDPQRVLDVVRHHLPEPNRRVLLHVISFLQLFVAEDVVEHTKMTEEGLARVMTPNLIRGRTGDLDVAFRNNHFENIFVGMLLRHMDCSTIDPGYKPMHGRA